MASAADRDGEEHVAPTPRIFHATVRKADCSTRTDLDQRIIFYPLRQGVHFRKAHFLLEQQEIIQQVRKLPPFGDGLLREQGGIGGEVQQGAAAKRDRKRTANGLQSGVDRRHVFRRIRARLQCIECAVGVVERAGDLRQVAVDDRDVRGDLGFEAFDCAPVLGAFEARIVPLCDLGRDEDAEHDDEKVDRDGGPFLLAQMLNDAAKEHEAPFPHLDVGRAGWQSGWAGEMALERV